ncbi:uncharacterized protein TNIN_429041 [Trichonephila inaurata madagascariensis]|uniref:Uncharacterized protein n=1 Tax=Trichonephila inaurata madagascariensis TaxID=2747483 RepID=A0A8X6XZE7_9ARAC|nr:uncharacterized protein TNIN_429041 [Trichonephila inaurata madagascariensis]
MEQQVDDQSVTMEDLGPPPPPLTDEQRCLNLHGLDKEVSIFTARKDYITEMLEIEKSIPSPTPETTQAGGGSEEFDAKIKILEGKRTEFLPFSLTLCKHNYKFKAVKRPADPVIRQAKFTAKASKNLNSVNDFVFPKKAAKNIPTEKNEQVNTSNSFAALNTAN